MCSSDLATATSRLTTAKTCRYRRPVERPVPLICDKERRLYAREDSCLNFSKKSQTTGVLYESFSLHGQAALFRRGKGIATVLLQRADASIITDIYCEHGEATAAEPGALYQYADVSPRQVVTPALQTVANKNSANLTSSAPTRASFRRKPWPI